MNLQFDESDFRPLVADVVREVLDQTKNNDQRLNGRLAYHEAEAAELIGVARHTLRDCRLRGEITGSRIGKRIVYARDELLRFIRRREV